MIQLNLPPFKIKLHTSKKRLQIFDILRRKFVAMTPEEWVRQHFVHYLIEEKSYPPALLANEVHLQVGEKTLRADTVVYDQTLKPLMIIEYKAPHIPITQEVFEQVSAYNLLLHVDYLVMSNGMNHYACKMDYEHKKCLFLEGVPNYQEILTKDR